MFPRVLRLEILVLLAAKAALLAALYYAFFSPHHRLAPTPEQVRSHLLGDRNP